MWLLGQETAGCGVLHAWLRVPRGRGRGSLGPGKGTLGVGSLQEERQALGEEAPLWALFLHVSGVPSPRAGSPQAQCDTCAAGG